MKDPTRLLERDATAAELCLLRAGASEEPSAEAMQRLAAALGVGVAVSTVATKSTAAGLAARGAASNLAGKWLVLGALGVAGGAAFVLAGHGSTSVPAGSGHAAVSAPAAPIPTTPVVVFGTGEAAPLLVPPENAAPESVAAAPVHAAEGSRSSPSIAREIAALDSARRLLSAGNAQGALRALDGYQAVAKAGMLRQEATLLRIEALAAAGDQGSARRIAERFLREHPNSPHERRIRALVGEMP
jgi:hypothetical protein